MRAKGVELEEDESNDYQESSIFGKRFSQTGGVTAAVIESLKESEKHIEPKVCVANGAAECKKALLLMKVGRFSDDFLEGMVCEGGCVGGPSAYRERTAFAKDRETLFATADDRLLQENLKNYDTSGFSMHRD
jgi:ferredoxin hydrogenase large subunit